MRKIILSKRASKKLEKLLEYLELEWSLKVKNDFIKKLDYDSKNITIVTLFDNRMNPDKLKKETT
jgi:hypothetical protein